MIIMLLLDEIVGKLLYTFSYIREWFDGTNTICLFFKWQVVNPPPPAIVPHLLYYIMCCAPLCVAAGWVCCPGHRYLAAGD